MPHGSQTGETQPPATEQCARHDSPHDRFVRGGEPSGPSAPLRLPREPPIIAGMAVDVQQQDVPSKELPARGSRISDDFAYILPMGVFLLFVQAAVWWPGAYPALYSVKTAVVGAMLILLRRHYTRI